MMILRLCLVLCAISVARADDWYVDPVLGDDANTGTTQGDPWRTITHALATVPANADVIHLAPGVYDVTNGEVYPLPIRTGTRIVGDGGSQVTLLEGGGFTSVGTPPLYQLELQGVTLRGGTTGINAYSYQRYDVRLDLVDVQILDMAADGIFVDAFSPQDSNESAYCWVQLERVRVSGCAGYGAWASASAIAIGDGVLDFDGVDCEFSQNGDWGLLGSTYSDECCSLGYMDLARCRITENGRGIYTSRPGYIDGGSVILHLENSLVADNLGAGMDTPDAFVHESTLANNLGIGLAGGYLVTGSILHGNGDDLAGFAGTFEYSLTNDPDAPAGTGNLTGDPLFTDPANSDYRLRFGSPCVDAGDPAAPEGADVDGLPRPLDGDLDAVLRHDMGAHELAPLSTSGEPALGATVDLELWGPAGGSAVLFWRRGPVDMQIPTIYGVWYLGRPRTFWAQSATAPWPPATVGYPVPNDPSLVGLSVSFQALSTSGFGTLAFTNPVTLTFVE